MAIQPVFRTLSYALLFVLLACSSQESEPQERVSQTPGEQQATTARADATPAQTGSSVQPPYAIKDSTAVRTLEGGLKLYIIEEGTGAIPVPGSHVIINYHGMLEDGTVFDSSFDDEGVADFALNDLIRGWQVGLTEVPTGSRIKLIVPPEMGYGAVARPNIPANSTLIFDIDLISTY